MGSRTFADETAAAVDLLAQYELLEEVGASTQARVFRAHDRVLDQIVAVKLLHEETSRAGKTAMLLYLAARAAAGLNHPHIAEVYDQGGHEGTAFLTREYLDGPNLAALIDREGPLAARRAVALVLPLLDALAIAHKRGIVHGRLHPGNIVFQDKGKRAVLTDFGMALVPAGASEMWSPYLAPEGTSSPAADIYSMGAALFLLLVGHAPAAGAAETRIAGVSRGLDRVVRQALASDPADRPPSAEAFRDALATATGVALAVVWPNTWAGSLDTAVRVTPPRADRQTMRRRRVRQAATLVLAGSMAVASIAGLASIAQLAAPGAPQQQAPADGTPLPEQVDPTPTPSAAAPTMSVAQGVKTPTASGPRATATNSLEMGLTQAPTPTVLPPGALVDMLPVFETPVTSTGGSVNATVRTLSPLQLQGAYQQFDGQLNDQPAVALYGVDSGYNEGTLSFDLAALPEGSLALVVTGQDDALPDECTIELVLNGVTIYSGPSSFPNAPTSSEEESLWGQLRISLPDGVLQTGSNTLTIRNTMPGRRIGAPAVLISTLELVRAQ